MNQSEGLRVFIGSMLIKCTDWVVVDGGGGGLQRFLVHFNTLRICFGHSFRIKKIFF